jgi:hypothetical protein
MLAEDKSKAFNIKKAIKAELLWKTCKSCTHHVLVSTISDITLCNIYNKKAVAKIWVIVHLEYEDRTALAQSDMQVTVVMAIVTGYSS